MPFPDHRQMGLSKSKWHNELQESRVVSGTKLRKNLCVSAHGVSVFGGAGWVWRSSWLRRRAFHPRNDFQERPGSENWANHHLHKGFYNSLLYKQEVNNNLVSFVHKVTSRRIECPILGHKLSNEQSTSQNSESSPPSCPTPNTSTILLQRFTPFHITLFDTSHCTTLPLL